MAEPKPSAPPRPAGASGVRLRRVDPTGPGIARRGRGRGFEYFLPTGEKIVDADELARLRALAIPPAWRDVWISTDPHGHLQATGTDAAGRRQYRYHDVWREWRDAVKFDHMLDFARRLPQLRNHCIAVLDRDGLDRERVLACAVRLLDHGFFRIGTERAVEESDSVGLTTMLKQQVTIRDGGIVEFDYLAKGGKRTVRQLTDPRVVQVVRGLRRRRGGGPELLAFRRSDGRWVDITAADVNEVIKQFCGEDSSAKDFRTWNATVLAAVALAVTGAIDSATGRRQAMTRACREVAHYLGNTPTVARSSYIDPRVFDRFEAGWSIAGALDAIGDGADHGVPSYQGEIEQAVLDLLENNTEADGIVELDDLVADLSDSDR
ncbi:MAG TPA: hypothetical protein VK875_02675 [Euzebyales bacterium]|nr:hypothetical protein [Euzebyales bacterium]